jgi:hypothetical protein
VISTAPIPQSIDSVIRHYDESSAPFDVNDRIRANIRALIRPLCNRRVAQQGATNVRAPRSAR